MGLGYLTVQVHTADDALPVAGAEITVYFTNGKTIYKTTSDANGNTERYRLPAPDRSLTLDPNYEGITYALYNVEIKAKGFLTKYIISAQVFDTQVTILTENMKPLLDEEEPKTEEVLEIAAVALQMPAENRQAVPPPSLPVRLVERAVVIPDYITVHLGVPTDVSAENVRVRFPDYIKNVASSEIYSTWPLSSLEANINVIVTFALNRIYTEWYTSRGFDFNITNSTSYDMAYRQGGPVFENISELVDALFNIYARRFGFANPYFTQFCNGTTVTCDGLSQWGTVSLADEGATPLEMLRFYYTDDMELVSSDNITSIPESYPGSPLSAGSEGAAVRRMQNYLNRINVNYPLIQTISNPNGIFGEDTEQSVKTFQRTFNLTADGVIGEATWNKISFIFVAVTRLAELDSEGIRRTIGETPPTAILTQGATGEDVLQLQFILNFAAPYYVSIPPVIQNGVFDANTRNSVIQFQKTFELPVDGIVGYDTWQKLYSVYRGIEMNAPLPPQAPLENLRPPYPGTPLQIGSSGADVTTMQSYLNVINAVYPQIPGLIVDGNYGADTANAVQLFQQANGLTPTGIIDEETWEKIIDVYMEVAGRLVPVE